MGPSGNDFVRFALSVLGTQKDGRPTLRCTGGPSRLPLSLPPASLCDKSKPVHVLRFAIAVAGSLADNVERISINNLRSTLGCSMCFFPPEQNGLSPCLRGSDIMLCFVL